MEDTERVVADNSGSSGALQACMLNKRWGGGEPLEPAQEHEGLFLQHPLGSPSPMPYPGSQRPHLRKLRGRVHTRLFPSRTGCSRKSS